MHFYNPIMCGALRASEMLKNTTNVLDINLIIHGRDNL